MIGSDIVDLLKHWARVPKNETFTELFLYKQIHPMFSIYYNQAVSLKAISAEMQKFVESNKLKVTPCSCLVSLEHAEHPNLLPLLGAASKQRLHTVDAVANLL